MLATSSGSLILFQSPVAPSPDVGIPAFCRYASPCNNNSFCGHDCQFCLGKPSSSEEPSYSLVPDFPAVRRRLRPRFQLLKAFSSMSRISTAVVGCHLQPVNRLLMALRGDFSIHFMLRSDSLPSHFPSAYQQGQRMRPVHRHLIAWRSRNHFEASPASGSTRKSPSRNT